MNKKKKIIFSQYDHKQLCKTHIADLYCILCTVKPAYGGTTRDRIFFRCRRFPCHEIT